MDSLIKVSVVLMLCEIGSAKDLLKYIQGNNATVYLDEIQMDVNATLEINFVGYTSNRHFTNVMIYNHENGKEGKASINSNYTGRIQRIVMSNGNLSFLLLNASFKDSGKYTVRENSVDKRNTSVLVVGRILSAYPGQCVTHSFIFSETNTSSIKIESVTSSVRRTALFYNVSKGDCNSADVSIVEDIEMRKCERKTDEFSFTFPNITWLHKGGYFAWDEKGRLLDSIFIDVVDSEMDKASPCISNSKTENDTAPSSSETGIGLLISALLIALISAFLVIIALRKHRRRRARKTTTHSLTHWNGNQTFTDSSQNRCQNLKRALISEEIRTVPTKINSDNHTDFKNNKVQAIVRMYDKNIYAKGFSCPKSSMRTACKLHSNSKLLLSESAPGDDYLHEYDELKSFCLTDCSSNESCLRSSPLDNRATESTADSSIEYDYVIQHTFMTLRPPAPDPIVTTKNKKQTKIEKFLYSFKNVNIKPLSRVLPATLYAKLEKKRATENHFTGSSVEQRSLDLTNEICPPCSFELENDLAEKTIDSPNVSNKGDCQQKILRGASALICL